MGLLICIWICMYCCSWSRSSDPLNSERMPAIGFHCGTPPCASRYSLPTPAMVPIIRWISCLAACCCSSVPAMKT